MKILTDQKPIQYAFQQRPEKASQRQARQLDFISQYTTNIEHVSGEENAVADFLSRIGEIVLSKNNNDNNIIIDYKHMASEQVKCQVLKSFLENQASSSLEIKKMKIDGKNLLYCDISSGSVRPMVPACVFLCSEKFIIPHTQEQTAPSN